MKTVIESVPLLDLRAQYASLKEEIRSAVDEVLESQRCIGGPKVEELENRIADYCGSAYAVGASSGTDAILNCLMALGVGPGDEVITTPFTFFATAGCICRVGAKPVFVDIEPDTYNINTARIEQALTDKTRAIIPIHLYGQCADMNEINTVAKKHGLFVIEDAAQALGAEYHNKKSGSFGTAGCFSFFPSKNLGGIGDGGMIVTDDEDLASKLKVFRDHGQWPRYHYKHIGGNFRLDAVQAAALLVKLPYLDGWAEKRREHAEFYNERFRNAPIKTPKVKENRNHVYNQYVIAVDNRDGLDSALAESNIGHAVYYPIPLHMNECFEYLGYKKGDFPEAEKAAQRVIALPVYPEMTEEMLEYTARTVLEFVNKN